MAGIILCSLLLPGEHRPYESTILLSPLGINAILSKKTSETMCVLFLFTHHKYVIIKTIPVILILLQSVP